MKKKNLKWLGFMQMLLPRLIKLQKRLRRSWRSLFVQITSANINVKHSLIWKFRFLDKQEFQFGKSKLVRATDAKFIKVFNCVLQLKFKLKLKLEFKLRTRISRKIFQKLSVFFFFFRAKPFHVPDSPFFLFSKNEITGGGGGGWQNRVRLVARGGGEREGRGHPSDKNSIFTVESAEFRFKSSALLIASLARSLKAFFEIQKFPEHFLMS